jgi:mono/diheme cytochrome c family protein
MDRQIRPGDLGVTRLLRVFMSLSVIFVLVLAVAPARSYFSEWRAVQQRYNRAARDHKISVGVQQIWKPELEVADRCGTCHVAADRAAPIAGDKLFAAHPTTPHLPRELGCTLCHAGQGRATTSAAAHGDVPHWDEPILPLRYVEAGCGICHSHLKLGNAALIEKGAGLVESVKCRDCHSGNGAPDLATIGLHGFRADWHAKHVEKSAQAQSGKWATSFQPLADDEVAAVSEYLHAQVGAPKLMAAKALAHRKGCRGCHRINGVGGDDGPDLSDEGRRRLADLDFAHVAGPRTLPSWLKAHFLDPPGVVAGSQMPKLGFTDGEADQLTLYMLSLRQRPIPEVMSPRDRVRGLRLGERDFPSDGASLFGVFCAACHGPRGEGRKFPTLESTFPAIGEPEFLAVADDNFLRKTLMAGRPGRRMPAWGTKDGGLRPEEIDALIGYLRSLEPTAPSFESVQAAPLDAARGTQLFAQRCAPCHGDKGEGSAVAPPLAAEDNPATHEDSRIYGTLTVGVAGTAMGSFRQLDAASLHALIAAVRALPPTTSKRTGWAPRTGDPKRGATIYATSCARCHGEKAEGKQAPALGNAAFLAAATDGYLTATILRGRGPTAMPHFGSAAADHARLGPDEVADAVAFIRSLAERSTAAMHL